MKTYSAGRQCHYLAREELRNAYTSPSSRAPRVLLRVADIVLRSRGPGDGGRMLRLGNTANPCAIRYPDEFCALSSSFYCDDASHVPGLP
jgi:hypothetical protein